jgi:rubrerythrin
MPINVIYIFALKFIYFYFYIYPMSTGEEEPVFPQDNIYPINWDFSNDTMRKLYVRAKREQWDEDQINWESINGDSFTREQRLAMAYWWTVLSTFDNAAPTFAKALIYAHEKKMDHYTKGFLTTLVWDENRHNIMCGYCVNRLLPGFPLNFKPQNEIERKVRNCALWVWYNGSRYWRAYLEAYKKYSFNVLFTSFMMGEAAATTIFGETGKRAKIEAFSQLFKNTARDESRHFAFTHALLNDHAPKLSEEEKKLVTKQVRAGFVFLSLIMYKPPKEFWQLPPYFTEIHEKMEAIARDAGLGILTLEEKEIAWRNAVLRVGANLNKYGIKMPAIPEIGITGEEVEQIKDDEMIIVF